MASSATVSVIRPRGGKNETARRGFAVGTRVFVDAPRRGTLVRVHIHPCSPILRCRLHLPRTVRPRRDSVPASAFFTFFFGRAGPVTLRARPPGLT